MPAIEISHLTKRYGSLTAVDDVSLTVAEGTVFALLGPNGAGKTTTIEILEGLRKPDSGDVRVLGLDPVRDHTRLHRRVGVMLQDGGIYPGAKPVEVARLFASYHDDPRNPDELLEVVGLTERRATLYRRLSGGERQRLSLALALIGRPDLVFLDEPTAGMDPAARRSTWDLIEGLRRDGVTVLLSTHFMDEAEHLADQVVIVHRGRVVAEGAPGELVRGRGGLSFSGPVDLPLETLTKLLGSAVHSPEPGRYVAALDGIRPAIIATLAAWMAERGALLTELRVGASGLEDVFLDLTKDGPT